MNKWPTYPYPQEFTLALDNSASDLNILAHDPASPSTHLFSLNSQSTLLINQQETKLVFINNQRNPLTQMPLFKNYLDESTKSKVTLCPTKDILNFYKVKTEEIAQRAQINPSPVEFNSNFESGNLQKAYQHSDTEFVLILHRDYGNPKYTHWFYFEAKAQVCEKFTFHIVNISKKDLSLMKGMKIVVGKDNYWQRGGENVQFRETAEFLMYFNTLGYYVLSFSYTFKDKKPVSFAYSFPYTHKQLSDWLRSIKHHHRDICSVTNIGTTLSGTRCEMITITSEIHAYAELKKSQISEKKAIILCGRVHPSESPSSYIIQGAVNFLLGKSHEAKALRKTFVFKIIPMMNPDGVKYGNSRCSLLGIDLNRRWIQANEVLHPEIFAAKEIIRSTKEMHEIALYCDIHSHAKKRNIFMYGCRVSNPTKAERQRNKIAKLLPILLERKNSNFSYKDSHFKMEKDKESTGRIVVNREFGVSNSYTLETSFFGKETGESFGVNDWETIGADLASLCINLSSFVAMHFSLKVAMEWLDKKKEKKVKSKGKNKIKKGKGFRKNLETLPICCEWDAGGVEDFEESGKLPQLNIPGIAKSREKRNKSINVTKFRGEKQTRSSLKESLDLVSNNRLLESFPSLESLIDKKQKALYKMTIC